LNTQSELQAIFSDHGPLAKQVPGFRLRQQQLEMAMAIEEAIIQNQQLVAEAGTGTGKTFAYLVPALIHGGKVIISTGTKTLQDQLFNRDIPAVRKALNIPVTIEMLKGRSNYICRLHLEQVARDGRFTSREDAKYIPIIQQFSKSSLTGDKSDLLEVPENASVWPMVTSTRDNCLGQDCEFHADCFVMEARKKAMTADIVVVNHHLFFADMILRDGGFGELLPSANTIIFDEAHQLPDVAGLFMGQDISTSHVFELARDVMVEYVTHAKDIPDFEKAIKALEKSAKDFRLIFPSEGSRWPQQRAFSLEGFRLSLDDLINKMQALTHLLDSQKERTVGFENCLQRALEIGQLLKNWLCSEDPNLVRWVEVFSHSLLLHATPLSIAEGFGKQLNAMPRAWIFTSATIAVKGNFSHFIEQMGLSAAKTQAWDSPFNYAEQALFYVPEHLDNPNHPAHAHQVASLAHDVIKASQGRAFILCTSLRAMREIHAILLESFQKEGLEYPLLLQGECSKTELLGRFRHHGHAVLIGSQSFWEGIDVRGEALSCVIIDKLPFAPPDDPVLSARVDELVKQGKNAFREYQVPYAVITLKQGAGRLIRDESDRGVLVICDSRLIQKPYGRLIWQSLPPFKRTRNLQDVIHFFRP
jgi:ATP-dependent DNA helicase DinG